MREGTHKNNLKKWNPAANVYFNKLNFLTYYLQDLDDLAHW